MLLYSGALFRSFLCSVRSAAIDFCGRNGIIYSVGGMGNYFVDFFVELKFGLLGAMMNIVAAILIPVLFDELNVKKVRSWLKLALHMLICAVLMTVFCAVYYLWTSKGMPQICCAAVTVIYAIFFVKSNMPSRLMMAVSYISCHMNVFVICFSISDLLKIAGAKGEQVIAVLMCIIILTSCVLFLRNYAVRNISEIPVISVVLVCVVGAINIIYWVMSNVMDIEPALDIIFGIIVVVLLLFAYYSAYALSVNINKTHRDRAQAMMRMADERLMRASEENLESMRKLRHELKNQYAYMRLLLREKQYDKLDAYFSQYEASLPETLFYIDCGNRTINAIIAVEEGKAKSAVAKLDCRIEVPSDLPVKDIDLCTVIMNLINNAVEYCERYPELADRTVSVAIRLINNSLLIEVGNAIFLDDEKSALELKTSKPDKKIHGYGSKIVSEIAERYNGGVYYAVEGGRFVAKAMLFLPENTEKNITDTERK